MAGLLALIAAATAAQPLDDALRRKADAAADRGLRYLRGIQRDDGSWPGTLDATALAIRAFIENRHGYNESDGPFITRPMAHLLAHAQADGRVAAGDANVAFSTAAAAYAFRIADNFDYLDAMTAARDFLAARQHRDDPRHPYHGGIPPAAGRAPDLATMYPALESLRAAGLPGDDPLWPAALGFVTRCQDTSGGFRARPAHANAGADGPDGALTATGLAALLLAGTGRDDTRVLRARDWLARHWSVARNPGAGDGYYPYVLALAKSLYFLGVATLTDGAGTPHHWRPELARRLIAIQDDDGAWRATASTHPLEANDAYATAQAVMAISYVTASAGR